MTATGGPEKCGGTLIIISTAISKRRNSLGHTWCAENGYGLPLESASQLPTVETGCFMIVESLSFALCAEIISVAATRRCVEIIAE